MAGCKLENCQLKDDVADIKEKQQTSHDSTLRMEVKQDAFLSKFDEFMVDQKEKNKTFYDRTRWMVTWKGLALLTAGGISATYTGLLIAEKIGG